VYILIILAHLFLHIAIKHVPQGIHQFKEMRVLHYLYTDNTWHYRTLAPNCDFFHLKKTWTLNKQDMEMALKYEVTNAHMDGEVT